jgi:hydrogenase maturation protein HypF
MASFPMCPDCEREYNDPSDRRFHAQPVACPACGPQVTFERLNVGTIESSEEAIVKTCKALANGEIVAIKGLGGFHLACDAMNSQAVNKLRIRKLRVDKPFAVMMPDIETVEAHCFVSDTERELLLSTARPIVLLRRRPGSDVVEEVAPSQDWVGVMLPYTPLHYLLFAGTQFTALVLTSGNLAEEPIATDNEEARERLSKLADAFLMHNRDIHIRCDDSVVRIFVNPQSTIKNRKSIYPIRRSRGYSPFPVKLPFEVPQILAAGSELKNTFCITNKDYAFLSHHIGDMENYETLKSFEQSVEHFEKLFRVKPEAIAYDMHPDYLATRYALERSAHESLLSIGVQHHHAHIAACMAEHGLDGTHPVIGVAFDGTGYGEDGAIWGGEILIANYKSFQRRYHLEYFPLPGGDAAIKKPARTALALLWALGLEWDERLAPTIEYCADNQVTLRTQLERKINTPLTSSMGRLFDAAAALAGLRQQVNYEGQAAIELEALADPAEDGTYSFEMDQDQVRVRTVLEMLIRDVLTGVPISKISARFHNGVAESIREMCLTLRSERGIDEVALSGGVWQNITLLRRTLSLLEADGFRVYLHREVPPNDGGLSLGQAVIAAARMRG